MDNNAPADVIELVGALARRMQDQLVPITKGMGSLLADSVSGIGDDPDLVDLLNASIGANVSTFFNILANDIPLEHLQPPTAAVEYALRVAQRGVPGNALRRAYHVGQDDLMTAMFAEIQSLDCTAEQKMLVLHHTSQVANAYVDWITQYVLKVYESEKQRWLDASSNMSSSLIHKLVNREHVKPELFEAETGYCLDQFHLGIVVWAANDDPDHGEILLIQQYVHDLAGKGGAEGAPILTAIDRSTAWAWLPLGASSEAFDLEAARHFAESNDWCRVGLGLPSQGSGGFTRSHEQAQAVRTLAAAMHGTTTPAISYGDQGVAICSVLARDIDATRTWVHEVLGSLASHTEGHARLRETLRVFLGTGGSYTVAAERLSLHRNSVKYRVVKAAEERGRPFDGDRLDVELALQVCHFLGSAVMTTPTAG